jgi:hypothetical protein
MRDKKDCRQNQIENPRSGRCVLKDGKIGRDILRGPTPMKKDCRQNQIENPKSGRCVLKDGRIGRDVLRGPKSKAAPKSKPETKPKAKPTKPKSKPKAAPKSKPETKPKAKPTKPKSKPKANTPKTPKEKCFDMLCKTFGANGKKLTRKDYHNWMRTHHPDKSNKNHEEIVKEINNCWDHFKNEISYISNC